jgi:hypothetical protein
MIMNDELLRRQKEVVFSKVLSEYLPGGTEIAFSIITVDIFNYFL